jgi:hypothetical protein
MTLLLRQIMLVGSLTELVDVKGEIGLVCFVCCYQSVDESVVIKSEFLESSNGDRKVIGTT